MTALERFLNYIKYDTESEDDSITFPSTEKQLELLKALKVELEDMGAFNVRMDDYGYVYATIPSNMGGTDAYSLGFLAHVDTSPAISGKNVKARIEKYQGGKIVLNDELEIFMDEAMFPYLSDLKGQDLIVTDGTTLLGADDKAGVAEIMTMAEILLTHPEIKHREIQIAFTPDEEVGAGVDHFNVKGFGAKFAYTVDGGAIGEIEYENFNAATGKLHIKGSSIHPGDAKGKMINAMLLGMEFESLLPEAEKPQYTEGYEGFFHLDHCKGSVESADFMYIIRDHDSAKFEKKKALFKSAANFLNEKYGSGTVECYVTDSYYNMKAKVEPHMFLIEDAKSVMEEMGIVPKIVPIRGGTDGARLSYMGIPCPNLCAGGYNFHGKYEFIPVESLDKIANMLVKLACK